MAKKVRVKLEKRYGLCYCDTITIELEETEEMWEVEEVIKLAETAVLNSWSTSLEEVEEDEEEE